MPETIKFSVQNEDFGKAVLSGDERKLFNDQFTELFMPAWSLEREYISNRKGFLEDAIAIAKNELEEKTFGGFNAGQNELGISPIRPGHVGLAHSSGTTVAEADNVWEWAAAATAPSYTTGFENWIHSPSSATTALTVHEDSCIIPMYVVEESASPKIQTLKIDVGRSDVLYYDVRASTLRDERTGISLIPLPHMFWGPQQDVLVAIQTKTSGTIEPRLGGFTVALGSFLDATTYIQSGSDNYPHTRTTTST